MWRFYDQVKEIPGVTLYGDFSGEERSPVVTLNIAGMDSAEVAMILDEEYGISVRAGGHCAPLMHKALGTKKQEPSASAFLILIRKKRWTLLPGR